MLKTRPQNVCMWFEAHERRIILRAWNVLNVTPTKRPNEKTHIYRKIKCDYDSEANFYSDITTDWDLFVYFRYSVEYFGRCELDGFHKAHKIAHNKCLRLVIRMSHQMCKTHHSFEIRYCFD